MPLSVHKSGPFWNRKYTLLKPYAYQIDGYTRTLPKGWTFDGATFGWLIGLRKEASMEPAAEHDDMYEHRGLLEVRKNGKPATLKITKKGADDRYLRAIGDEGVNVKSWQKALIRAAFNTVGHIVWIT